MIGFIYALSNPAMPGLVKIGYTEGNPVDRAYQLQGSGVPVPFQVDYFWLVPDPAVAEAMVHEDLKEYRYNQNREFFQYSSAQLAARITSIIGNGLLEMWSVSEGGDAALIAIAMRDRHISSDQNSDKKIETDERRLDSRIWIHDPESKQFYSEYSPRVFLDYSELRLVPNVEIRYRSLRIPLAKVSTFGNSRLEDCLSVLDTRYENKPS